MTIDQGSQGREAASGGVTAQAKEQVQQQADEVRVKASGRVREQLDKRSTDIGDQATTFAQALRKAGDHLELEGSNSGAKVAHGAADRVQRVAGYLSRSGSDRFLADLENFGRQRPWAAGAVGAAIGFVGARFLKASSESRYTSSFQSRRDVDMPIGRDTEEPVAVSPLTPPTAYGGYEVQ